MDSNNKENNETSVEETAAQPRKNRKLPALSTAASDVLEQFAQLDATDRTQFMVVANERIRADSASASRELETKFEIGDEVVVRSGVAEAIGLTGTIDEARRVRLFVKLENGKRVYLFTSDVEKIGSVSEVETEDHAADDAEAIAS